MDMQQRIALELGVKPEIDEAAEIAARVVFLKRQVRAAGAQGLLIAVSGDAASAAAAGLCKRATDELSAEDGSEYMTLGVFQPCGEEDVRYDMRIAGALGLDCTARTNIEDAVGELALEAEYALKALGRYRHLNRGSKEKLMTAARAGLQSALAEENRLLVVGTGHAASRLPAGAQPAGREAGAVDVEPLRSLSGRQVRRLAAALGVSEEALAPESAAPLPRGTADSARTDDYLEGKPVPPETAAELERRYEAAELRGQVPGI